jgi:hypothetical protein
MTRRDNGDKQDLLKSIYLNGPKNVSTSRGDLDDQSNEESTFSGSTTSACNSPEMSSMSNINNVDTTNCETIVSNPNTIEDSHKKCLPTPLLNKLLASTCHSTPTASTSSYSQLDSSNITQLETATATAISRHHLKLNLQPVYSKSP